MRLEYEPPLENITTIDHIDRKNGNYSFEKEIIEIATVRDHNNCLFLRVNERITSAEGNGRPETRIGEYLYPIPENVVIDKSNWKQYENYSKCIVLKSECIDGV